MTLAVQVQLLLGRNTYLLFNTDIVNFVWKTDEGEAESIVTMCIYINTEYWPEHYFKAILSVCSPFNQETCSSSSNVTKWNDIYQTDLDQIKSTCELCIAYKPTSSQPVVSLPLANKFNQCVVMDLKQWNNKWILYPIDLWS